MEITNEILKDLYYRMLRIRFFEEAAGKLFENSEMPGFIHLYVGEEAVAAGVCVALRDDDQVGSTHRGHGHLIAKGGDLPKMMAELMGRETGYCGGLGGSMHIADMELNILGANGIVGAAMPLGTGAALAAKMRGTDQVVVAFFGDGASNQGIFHESINLAAVWKLPIVYLCENNQWALNTSYRQTTAVERISARAASYDIPGITVDGNDVLAVHAVMRDAVARARAVAVRTRTYIDEAHEKARNDAGRYGEVAARYRTLNQDARQRGDQVAMSSLTLAIIYLGAEAHGPACAPARAAIDEFLGHWSHVEEGT